MYRQVGYDDTIGIRVQPSAGFERHTGKADHLVDMTAVQAFLTLAWMSTQCLDANRLRGEFVLVVEGNQKEEVLSDDAWQEEALSMQRDGIYAKEIANSIGERYGILRNKIKKFLLEENREDEE